MGVILKNNAVSTITTTLSASDVGLAVAAGTGSLFPTLGAGDYFYATLVSSGGTYEVIKVTARVNDTMTIVRAQEGTTAQSFASGSRLEARVTAASITDMLDYHDQASEISFSPTGTISSTDVQSAIVEVRDDVSSLQASQIGFVPTGTITATNTQSAIAEVSTDVSALSSALGGAAFSNVYNSTTAGLSSGVLSTTSLVGGSGGTDGTFDVAFSGGSGTGAAARFTVSGGTLVSIVITNPGTGYTSAPTLSFAASSGLSGASAVAIIGPRQPVNTYFYVPGSGETSLLLYRVDAGPVATLVSSQLSAEAINNLAGTVSAWPDPFFKLYNIGEQFLGRNRWFNPTTNYSLVPSSVFLGGRALRRNVPFGDLGGPRVWLDEIGAVPGDTITIRAIMTTTAATVRLGIRFITEAGSSLGAQEIGTPDVSSSTPTLTSVTTVVPSSAAAVRVYFFNITADAGTFDCHALWVCKGGAADSPSWPSFGADLVGSELAQQTAIVDLPALTDRVELVESTDAYAFLTYGGVTPEPTTGDVTLAVTDVTTNATYGSPFRGWGERYTPAGISFNALRFRAIGRSSTVTTEEQWRTLSVVVRASTTNAAATGSTLVAVGETLVNPSEATLEDVVVILRDPVTNDVKTLTDADLSNEYFIGTYFIDSSGGTAFGSPHTATQSNALGSPQSYYITSANPETGSWSTWTSNRRVGCDHLLLTDPQDVTLYAPTQQLINDIGGGPIIVPNSYNRESLRQYAAKLTAGDAISIALIGDSWTNTAYRIFTPLRSRFDAELGISAPGYISANTDNAVATNGIRTRTGTWTGVRASTAAVGPDNAHVSTTDTAATLAFGASTTVGKFFLHYLQQPNGGTFRYSVSGGATTDINTDGTLGYQVLEINGPGTLNITIVSAGSAGVLICGCEVRNTVAGQVVLHKLGSGGARASHFSDMGAGYLEAAYQSLAPDVVVITLGTNDQAGGVGLSTFRGQVANIVNRIHTTMPLTDILLLGPGPNNTSASYPITSYIEQLYDLASELDCAFVDLISGFGPYNDALARGLFIDAVHPSEAGGLVLGRTVWRAMFTE